MCRGYEWFKHMVVRSLVLAEFEGHAAGSERGGGICHATELTTITYPRVAPAAAALRAFLQGDYVCEILNGSLG